MSCVTQKLLVPLRCETHTRGVCIGLIPRFCCKEGASEPIDTDWVGVADIL